MMNSGSYWCLNQGRTGQLCINTLQLGLIQCQISVFERELWLDCAAERRTELDTSH